MADVIFIGAMIGFFALCTAYVSMCERIVGEPEPTTRDAEASRGTSAST